MWAGFRSLFCDRDMCGSGGNTGIAARYRNVFWRFESWGIYGGVGVVRRSWECEWRRGDMNHATSLSLSLSIPFHLSVCVRQYQYQYQYACCVRQYRHLSACGDKKLPSSKTGAKTKPAEAFCLPRLAALGCTSHLHTAISGNPAPRPPCYIRSSASTSACTCSEASPLYYPARIEREHDKQLR